MADNPKSLASLADELDRECTCHEHNSPTRALLAKAAAALRAPTIAADDAALVARLRGEYEPWPKPWMRVVQDYSGRRDCEYFDTESEARQTRKGGYSGDDGVWVEQDPSILTNAAADRLEAALATPSPTIEKKEKP